MCVYKVKEVREWGCFRECKGAWLPARPENYKYRSLRQRLAEAYKAFTGELDALKWD